VRVGDFPPQPQKQKLGEGGASQLDHGAELCDTCIAQLGGNPMTAVSLRLPEDLRIRLEKLAKRTGRSKTFYMVEAITEKLEDLEDLYLVEQRTLALREGRSKTYTLDEVEKRLGLVD
jgi:RHH-type rel operon transcriptional repressor/antitoxin RelB